MKKLFLLFAALFVSTTLQAQPIGYAFLRTSAGARPSAMAGSFIAISQDANSIYYNPAGIADITKRSASFGYLNHILDFNNFSGAYIAPHKNKGAYGIAVQYTDYGSFKKTNSQGDVLGTFGANNLIAYGTYSQMFKDSVLVGVNLKYIRSVLESSSSNAIAFDIGLIYHSDLFNNVSFGIGLFNIGKAIDAFVDTKESLPFNFQFGVSKQLAHLPLRYSFTLVKYEKEDFELRAGGEFLLATGLFFRVGYNSLGQDQKVGTDKDKFAGISVGLGLDHNNYKFDYGLSSFGEIGSINRMSLSMKF